LARPADILTELPPTVDPAKEDEQCRYFEWTLGAKEAPQHYPNRLASEDQHTVGGGIGPKDAAKIRLLPMGLKQRL